MKLNLVKKISGLFIISFTLVFSSHCNEADYIDNNSFPELSDLNSEITGLDKSDIIQIRNDAGDVIDVTGSGQMYLAETLIPVYSVSNPELITSPDGKNCSLNLENTPENNNLWSINCIDIKYYSISVNIDGLEGTSLGLQLDSRETAFIQNNGLFTFQSFLPENSNYSVSIISMPQNSDQLCSISNPKGIVRSNITNISVTCASNVQFLSGSISGPHSGFSLKNSNGEVLQISPDSENFSFSEFLPENYSYTLTVESQPANQECYISNSRGKVKNNTGNIEVICNISIDIRTEINLDENLADIAEGKNLELWFYSRSDQIVYPLFKRTFIYEKNKIFTYKIPFGQYYIRGFIDMNENSLPEIGPDYQSRPFPFLGPVSDETNSFKLDLNDTTSDAHLSMFNAYTMKTQEWRQPAGGKCGGEYLFLEASGLSGKKSMLSDLFVLTPDQKTIELLDDGGCGNSFSNLSSSYDRQKDDNIFSAGIELSKNIQPGEYIFYYINYFTEKITIIKDSVNQVEPLSSLLYLVQPNGQIPVNTPTPLFEWNPVAGAGSYEVIIESTDHSINNFNDPSRFVKNNFYQFPFELPDRSAFRVSIQAFDRDLTEQPDDFDAVSRGPDNYFITDFTGTNSLTISGKLVNNSGATGSYMIYADGNTEAGNWESSVFLTDDKNTYSLSILRNPRSQGAMISSLNVDESGYLLSSTNQIYSIWRNFFQTGENQNIELSWYTPLILSMPESFEAGTGGMPLFMWENYETQTQPFSYILWLQPINTTVKPVIIGLTDNYFDFRYLPSAPYVNLGDFYNLLTQSTAPDSFSELVDLQSRLTGGLDENTQWEWHVKAVKCSMEDIDNKYNKTVLENYSLCIARSFASGENIIGESQKRVFSAY